MEKFEASTLEEAYAKAAEAFSCSVTELEIEVVQNPSRGFLGLGKKPAVIVATCPAQERKRRVSDEETTEKESLSSNVENITGQEVGAKESSDEEQGSERIAASVVEEIAAVVEEVISESSSLQEDGECEPEKKREKRGRLERETDIFENFYTETPDIQAVIPEVERKINDLFAHACFKIDPVRVSVYDEETLLIEFNGADAALLIGKEGYRYKALAYLLYNWIHGQYGFRVRLEIAEFLYNQERMIENYLEPIVERVEKEGRAQTKVLDGILVQIALKRLRDRFPNKYVAVRTNREGGRYIIVNEFLEKR